MELPAIVWRNPNNVQRRRLWNQAHRETNHRVFIVVRSGFQADSEWEGLPNLEMIEGGAMAPAGKEADMQAGSRG